MSIRKVYIRRISLLLTLLMIMTSVLPGARVKADINAAAASGSSLEAVIPTPEASLDQTSEPILEPTPGATPTEAPEPAPTAALEPTPTAALEPAPTAALEPTPTAAMEPTPTAAPEPTTTPTMTLAPTATSTPTPFRSKTLEKMSKYDYVGNSVTGLTTTKLSVTNLQMTVKAYGSLYGSGMPTKEYVEAMTNQWEDYTEYDIDPIKINIDIKNTMNYATYVSTLKKLSRYQGVYLYKIGKSTEGRDLFAIEVDVESANEKNVIMLTGQIHAREFAGGTYIVKQLVDLVQKAQTDKKTMELLKTTKFVAVPIINVDGREALIYHESKWKTKRGELLKAYTNKTDGGRNFPGLQWGQVAKGSTFRPTIAKSPDYANYPGAYAGSNRETKALMKWLYHYTVVDQAVYYLDYHQQGSIIYAGKTWQTQQQAKLSTDLRKNVTSIINKGITRRKYTNVYEGGAYGMRGEGSSLTDYAITLAVGAKFSPAYGFHVFPYNKKEYLLMQIKDLDKKLIKVTDANKRLGAITMEIGYGKGYLGNSAATRRLLASEYKAYKFDTLLEKLPAYIK